jgi:ribosomal protein S18 acetylase RimI-like enzyme
LEGFFIGKQGDIMTIEAIIRKAGRADVPSILELWKELMDFHKERDQLFSRSATGHESFADFITGHISSETSNVFVAEAGKDIVGYCIAIVEKYPPVLEIQEYGLVKSLAVTEEHRHSGIGKRLLEEAQSWFSEKGVHRIEARVAKSNRLATDFWAKMGFVPYLETVFFEI